MKLFTPVLFFALTTLLSTFSLQGQFEIGLSLGGNFSGINYITVGQTDIEFEEIQGNMDEVTSTSSLLGFQGGIYANFDKGRFSICPELLYTKRGYAGKQHKHYLEYVTVPIRFKYHLGEQLSLDLGPEFNFILWNSYIRTSNGENFHELYRKVDVGASMGLTYKFQYQGRLSLKYVQGLNDMIASEYLPVSQRSKSIQLAFSYAIFNWEG